MSFTKPPSGQCGKRIQELRTVPDPSHTRQVDAPAAYRVDFYLIYVTISMAGFKMSWSARSRVPGSCASAKVASPVANAMHGGGGHTGAHTTPIADDDRNSGTNLCLVREFSTVLTSSAATRAIQWAQMTLNATVTLTG